MIEVEGAVVRYRTEGGVLPALSGVSCRIAPGRVVALAGANGSGKSTLARLLCGMRLCDAGSVRVEGHDPAASAAERLAVRTLVGLVQQSARDQIVSSSVRDEVAFGPRNLGLSEAEVGVRVQRALARCGLEGCGERGTNELSGGEQQRLALAGVLAMEPRYLVLDEPSAHLDARERPALRALLRGLAHEGGAGVVVVTHDPLEALEADEIVLLEEGAVRWSGAPLDLYIGDRALWDAVFHEDPFAEVLACALVHGWDLDAAGGRAEDPEALAGWMAERGIRVEEPPRRARAARRKTSWVRYGDAGRTLALKGVRFSYGAAPILAGVDLVLAPGRVALLAGSSGSGKSTLALLSAGLLEPDAGNALLEGAPVKPGWVAMAFQNPEGQFFLESVHDELAFAARNLGCEEDEVERRVDEAARLVGIEGTLLGRDPFALSGGQARLVGIASVLTLAAPVVLLDEPTAGLDARGRQLVHRLVRRLARNGTAVLVISHDLEEWLSQVDDLALLHAGRIAWTGHAARLRDDADALRALEGCGLCAPARLVFDAAARRLAGGEAVR